MRELVKFVELNLDFVSEEPADSSKSFNELESLLASV
jgi:hypothetical protein